MEKLFMIYGVRVMIVVILIIQKKWFLMKSGLENQWMEEIKKYLEI